MKKTNRSILTAVVLFLSANLANAAVLSQGMMYGGQDQAYAVCYLFNASTATVTVTSRGIFEQTSGGAPSTSLTLIPSDCSNTLVPTASCTIIANLNPNAAHACKFNLSTTSGIRGVFELRDVNGKVLHAEELR